MPARAREPCAPGLSACYNYQMEKFLTTNHLSDILGHSEKTPVIIFKYSNSCGTSSRLKSEFETAFQSSEIKHPVYLVTIQTQKSFSKSIEDYFSIKHESPQIIVVKDSKPIYSANHTFIKLKDLIYT